METHDSHNQNNGQEDEKKSMDAIRDLLFGQKTREIGDQIGDVERRIQSTVQEMEKRLNNRIDSLEQYVKGEINSTKEQFSAGGDQVKSLGDSLNERFGGVEEKMNKIESEGRSQVFERTKALSDEIAEVSRRMHEKVDGELNNLRQNSTRKNELSEMLIELGMRLQPPKDDHHNHGHHG